MNNDKQVNRRVRKAFDNATPNNYENIRQDCPQRQTATRTRPNYWKWASFAMAFVLLAVGVFSVVGMVGGNNVAMAETVVSLDVNPSLQINVDGNGRVIDVVANNDDARKILGAMDFSGSTLEVTVYALVGSMYANGYLSETSNSVLVDVDTKLDKTEIVAKVTAQIEGALNKNNVAPNVIVSKSGDELSANEQQQAEEVQQSYDISAAKARLIAQIMQKDVNGKHTVESLVALKVNDLSLILEGLVGASIGSGTASEGAYIGKDAALKAALEAFRIDLTTNVKDLKIKLDFEDGRMVYEVEFVLDGKKYECELVASRTVTDTDRVYELEIEFGNKPQKKTLTEAEKQELMKDITKKALVEAQVVVSVGNVLSVNVERTADDKYTVDAKFVCDKVDYELKFELEFDDDDCVVEVRFTYNNTEFEFEFDYNGELVKTKTKHVVGNEKVSVDEGKLYELLKERWNTRFGIFNLGVDDLKWSFEYDDGVIECETHIVTLTGRYTVTIEIDSTTGGFVDIDIERD